jgi:hypothetical protein
VSLIKNENRRRKKKKNKNVIKLSQENDLKVLKNLLLLALSCFLSSKFRYLQFQILHIPVSFLVSTKQRTYDVFTVVVG